MLYGITRLWILTCSTRISESREDEHCPEISPRRLGLTMFSWPTWQICNDPPHPTLKAWTSSPAGLIGMRMEFLSEFATIHRFVGVAEMSHHPQIYRAMSANPLTTFDILRSRRTHCRTRETWCYEKASWMRFLSPRYSRL